MKHPILIRSVSLLLALVMLMAYPASAAEIAALTDADATAADSSDPFDESAVEEASAGEASEAAADSDDADESEAAPVYLDSEGSYLAPETLVVYVNSYLTEGKDARADTSYTGIVAFYDYNETDEEEMLDNPYFFYYEDGVLQDEEELYLTSDRFLNLTSAPTTAAAASVSDVDEDTAVYSAEEVYVNYRDEDATEHPDYLFAFNVDGQANGLYTGYSDVMAASYDDGVLVVVTGISLTQSEDGKTPTLTWSAVSGAASYKVYRQTGSDSASVLASGVTSTSYTDSSASSSGTTYSYYVTAVLSDGSETSASDTVTYSCYNTSSSVKASGVAGGVKVSWSKVSDATGYRVLRQLSGSSTWTTVADIDSGSTTSYVDATASSNKTYSYTVRAYFGDKTSSRENYTVNVWSAAAASVSVYYLAAPVLGSHYTDTSGMHVVWSKVSGAEGYWIYRKTSASGSWTKIATVTSGSTTTYLDTGAKEGGSYYYTVRAFITNSSGTKVGSSYYTPDAPVTYYGIPTVTLTASASGVKVSWTADSAATGYRIFRKTSGGTWKALKDVTSGKTSSYVDTTASSGTTYYYTVRAYYGSGISSATNYKTGDWSSYKSSSALYFLSAPKLGTPYSDSTGMQVTWSKVTGATGYWVYRRTSSTGSWTKIATVTGASTVSYIDTKATANGTYYYTVRAYYKNAAGTTTGSGYYTPSEASVYHAALTATVSVVSTGLKVSWSADSSATGYRVFRKTSGGSWKAIATITKGTTSSYVDAGSNLTGGQVYYYAVRAYYGDSISGSANYKDGDWSSYVSAKYTYLTAPVVPSTLENNTTDTNGIKVTWNKVTGAAGYYIYRRTSTSASWSRIDTVTSGSTTVYLDTSVSKLSAGTTCYYTVVAFDSGKTSRSFYDTTGSVCVYLPMPEDLVVNEPTSSGTKITWSKVSGATSYIIYRRKSTSSSWSGTKLATVTTNSYTDTSVTSRSTIYYYTVVAVTTATVNGSTVTFRGTYSKTGSTYAITWSGSERNAWVKKDGKQYYVESNGTLATGWQYKTRNGSTYKYYFDIETGELVTNLYAYFGKSYRDLKYRVVTCVYGSSGSSTPSYTAIYLYNGDTEAYDIPAASWRSIGNVESTVARWSSLYLAAGAGQRWLTGGFAGASYEQYAIYVHGTPSWFHSILYRTNSNTTMYAYTYNNLEKNVNNSLACIRMQSIYAFLISDLSKNGYGKTHRTPVVLYKTSSVSAFGVPHLNTISTSRKTDPTDPDITGKFFYATTLYSITTTASSTTWVYY